MIFLKKTNYAGFNKSLMHFNPLFDRCIYMCAFKPNYFLTPEKTPNFFNCYQVNFLSKFGVKKIIRNV